MVIKKLIPLLALFLCVTSVSAQQSEADESVEFRPHWDLQLQGGVGYTIGESSTSGDLISPALYLSTNYRFHHAMGVRFGLGGWQGKGAIVSPESLYTFNFLQLNADYKLDLVSLFGGYNHKRVVGFYALVGVGLNYGFNNNEATSIAAGRPAWSIGMEYLWDKKVFVAGRMGLGLDFRVGERVLINLEANANVLSDKFNSKRADNADWQLNMLAGVSYSFGPKHRESKVWAAQQEAIRIAEQRLAEAEAARIAAQQQQEELARQEEERVRREEEQIRQQQELEAQRLAERAAVIKEHSENIRFTIGSANIRRDEAVKIERMAQWLVENEDYSVVIVGYADRETGTAAGNLRLSERRAEAVTRALAEAGVAQERITTSFVGDTEQPFDNPADNRVVICTLE
ncbi:MAG: OmpA family protein [Alistipes sp.]|nr:OmpA family protein [Alistipes sp.]